DSGRVRTRPRGTTGSTRPRDGGASLCQAPSRRPRSREPAVRTTPWTLPPGRGGNATGVTCDVAHPTRSPQTGGTTSAQVTGSPAGGRGHADGATGHRRGPGPGASPDASGREVLLTPWCEAGESGVTTRPSFRPFSGRAGGR